ncbi:MAG: Shikimate kinase [Actinotalea sp.]|nr:Shikimate kinase [Actinotalea sp.]
MTSATDFSERAYPGPRVVLVGPPGSGKSTVSRSLAHRLGMTARDTDADVEALTGRSISDIFVEDGEARFRELERAAVAAALAEHEGVLALGGGAVMDPLTEQALLDYAEVGGVVVFLDVSLAQAAPRVGFNTARPLLLGNPRAQWQALMEARRPVYSRVATLHVQTDHLRPTQVAAQIAETLAGAERPIGAPRPDRPASDRPASDRPAPGRPSAADER